MPNRKDTDPPESAIYNDESFADISDAVATVIEREFDGKFTGTGWRNFVPNEHSRHRNHK